MTYRITVKSNPRMLLLMAVMIGAVAVVVLLFAAGSALGGIIALIVVGYLGFHAARHLVAQLQSKVVTTDDGITLEHSVIGSRSYNWHEISRAGYAVPRDKRERPVVFIYDEEQDSLITIPDEFENFKTLMGEVRRHTDFENIVLAPGETVEARLAPSENDESE